MLTPDDLASFDDLGFVWLRGAFSPADAERMRAVVWRELDRLYGIQEVDASTWNRSVPSGLHASKRHRAFEPIGGPSTCRALNSLLGMGRWIRPSQWGQVLVTFPSGEPWVLPHALWHVDFRYDNQAAARLFGLKVFALFGDVAPRGGGTLLIAGSHRLVSQFVETQPHQLRQDFRRTRLAFMRSHQWLRALASPGPDSGREEFFMDHDKDVNGVPARVIEITGQAGDVVFTHPWTVHHVAPNASTHPRFMRAQSIYVDVAQL